MLGVISAPVPDGRRVRHWELDQIPVGSRLLGCARRVVGFVGVTTALAERRLAKPYPDPHDYDDVWVVDVVWTPLAQPLLVDDIPLAVRTGNTPFDKNGGGLQQYCIEIPAHGPVHTWLTHLPLEQLGIRTSQPGHVADGEARSALGSDVASTGVAE